MSKAQRERIWSCLQEPWDVIVVGGGITGAGILSEATARGLKALVVEQRDFAWGTSSRSSKLVHGGLRYLAQGQIRLVWESVREREQLLREGPGIVEPLGFLLANYRGDRPGRWTFAAGLSLYDMIAGCWQHERLGREEFKRALPFIETDGLTGGYRYHDATTDDARLVLRVLREAVRAGGTALNYAAGDELVREGGRIVGVRVRDVTGEHEPVVCRARVAVVNATGVWADVLRGQVDAPAKMRPLRGSHLVFPAERLPLRDAVALLHPVDGRALFAFPWEGASVIGTTDLDFTGSLEEEPAITPAEVSYLMTVAEQRFPSLRLTLDDVISSYCGIRPVINTGKAKPSDETREHVVVDEHGLVTVTGGKLTTFRLIARDALDFIRRRVSDSPVARRPRRPLLAPVADDLPPELPLQAADRRRLVGRHGAEASELVTAAGSGELERIGGTAFLWAELRWAARTEWVVHLDDLMLRRVRAGLLVRDGAREHLARARAICQTELGWSDARWASEEERYLDLCRRHYALPPRPSIPDWREPPVPVRESA